jgi:hypothetical protein
MLGILYNMEVINEPRQQSAPKRVRRVFRFETEEERINAKRMSNNASYHRMKNRKMVWCDVCQCEYRTMDTKHHPTLKKHIQALANYTTEKSEMNSNQDDYS